MWMKFAEFRRKVCGVAEESLRSCGEKVVKLQRKICGIAEENIRELMRKVCVAASLCRKSFKDKKLLEERLLYIKERLHRELYKRRGGGLKDRC